MPTALYRWATPPLPPRPAPRALPSADAPEVHRPTTRLPALRRAVSDPARLAGPTSPGSRVPCPSPWCSAAIRSCTPFSHSTPDAHQQRRVDRAVRRRAAATLASRIRQLCSRSRLASWLCSRRPLEHVPTRSQSRPITDERVADLPAPLDRVNLRVERLWSPPLCRPPLWRARWRPGTRSGRRRRSRVGYQPVRAVHQRRGARRASRCARSDLAWPNGLASTHQIVLERGGGGSSATRPPGRVQPRVRTRMGGRVRAGVLAAQHATAWPWSSARLSWPPCTCRRAHRRTTAGTPGRSRTP